MALTMDPPWSSMGTGPLIFHVKPMEYFYKGYAHLCHQVCYLRNVHLCRLLVNLTYCLTVSSLALFSLCGFSMQSPTLDFEYFSMILLVL